MKPEQERVRTLLLSTITQLCQNGLLFKKDIKVQGLLAITVDDDDIFVVQLDENLATKMDLDCVPATGLPEVPGLASPVASADFPIASKATEMLASQQTATGELAIARVTGGLPEVSNLMSCKPKVSPHFAMDTGRETAFVQNGDHGKMDGGGIDFGATADMKGATENQPVLLPAFSIPMTVNYSEMKAFQGAVVECFRNSNSDQVDYVFQDFTGSAPAVQGAHPGRLTCPTVTANSVPMHIQTGFSSDVGLGQTYQQFTSMLAAAPQNHAKLDLSGIGKRILPHAIGQTGSYTTGQAQVTAKKPKQESRLPRRPRESTEKRFRCQLCSLTYYYKKHLKFHMHQKHGIQQT